MVATLSQVVWESIYPAFGSPLLLFGFVVIFFIALFIVTKQNLASSLLLGMVAIDGLARIANLDYINWLNVLLKFLIFAIIGYAIAQKLRD